MSRHRNIRSLNYSDEIEHYDDDCIFGRSADEDSPMSPSQAEFMYDRTREPRIRDFIVQRNLFGDKQNVSEVKEFQAEQNSEEGVRWGPEITTTSSTTNTKIGKKREKQTPKTRSPSNSAIDLSNSINRLSVNEAKIDADEMYKRERPSMKQTLYIVIVGHVDAGKSTLMGHFLCQLGCVNPKLVHKYEQESRKIGKPSFMYAWILDETDEERNRGVTMDVGRTSFETDTKIITLLDAPGHRDFIPNMILGATNADVAILVVDATRGEFETGFGTGGQTREHTLLVRSLGVNQIAVVVNKLETMNWSHERFDEIVEKMKLFLKKAGFRDRDVIFVPCSGLMGENLVKASHEENLTEWYKGPCLLQVIESFVAPARPIKQPFRFSISDIIKSTGSGLIVSGRVETGLISVNNKILVCPIKEKATIKSLSINDDHEQNSVFAGDQAAISISGIDITKMCTGYLLCDIQNPIPISKRFEATIIVFSIRIPIIKGRSVFLHHQALVEPAVVKKLVAFLNKVTGEVMKSNPRYIPGNSRAVVEIEVARPMGLECYSDCKELGRIMLREEGSTLAAGLITKIF